MVTGKHTGMTVVYSCADVSADGSVLVVGAPDSNTSPRIVKVYSLENNAYVERANITAPANAPENSLFGQQARCHASQAQLPLMELAAG